MIKVLKPGLATSVQDLGREGYYHLGIPPSGALDQYALSAANHLVGNPVGAAGLAERVSQIGADGNEDLRHDAGGHCAAFGLRRRGRRRLRLLLSRFSPSPLRGSPAWACSPLAGRRVASRCSCGRTSGLEAT